jgi:hypothetical protein
MSYVLSPIGQAVLAHWGFLPADLSSAEITSVIALPHPGVR